MSTKIYNGIKFNSTNLLEIISELKKLVPGAQEIARQEITSRLLQFVIRKGNMLESKSYDIEQELKRELMEAKYQGNGPFKLQFSLFLYPHSNGKFYGAHFASNKEFKKLLFDSNICVDYHYQNQTDMSNYDWDKENWGTMSEERKAELEKDWYERDKIWEDLLGNDTFRMAGLEYTIVDGAEDLFWFVLREEDFDKAKTDVKKWIREDKLKQMTKPKSNN